MDYDGRAAERLNIAIEKAMRMARVEHTSNRLQNCLSTAIVIVRKEIKKTKIMEHKKISEALSNLNKNLAANDVFFAVYRGEGKTTGVFIHGKPQQILLPLVIAMREDEDFRAIIYEAIKIKFISDVKYKESADKDAECIVKEYLKNAGIKLEGEE